MGIVYLITNQINGKVYVGQTIRPLEFRYAQHKSEARRGRRYALYNAIRKYGLQNFTIQELSCHECDEELSLAEIASIYIYKSTDRRYGYNRTYGGEGTRATPEVCAKISKAQMGNTYALGLKRGPQSDEHRKRNSLAHRGLKRSKEALRKFRATMLGHTTSQETRDKISRAHMGIPFSEEHRKRLSESHLGHIPWNKGKKGYKIK